MVSLKITLMTLIPPTTSAAQLEKASAAVKLLFPEALEILKDLVRIPGIAWEAFDASQLDKSAEAVKSLFEELGVFDKVEILRAGYGNSQLGAPAIVATRKAKNSRPTILLYAHHDVQPPGDDVLWVSTPFEPEIRNGRMYGRGAADDKGGIIAHYASVKLLAEIAGADFDLGLAIFIEGEEEAGSPSFASFLETHKDQLEGDVIVVADSGNWSTSVPAITTTLRGLASLEFEVRTLDHAVHSGMYGGAVPDAMLALVRILGSMWDENGSVTISGLFSAEKSNLDYSEAQFRSDSGLLPSTLPIGTGPILPRIWTKPALTLIGLDYPTVALSSNTLVPSLKAKLSLRIAPGDDPERALEALKGHILAHNTLGAEITFGAVELGKPFSLGQSGWAKTLAEQSLSLAFGEKSVDIGIGGSIPFIADLERVFPSAQVLVTGVEDPDSRAHSPNESLHLEGFQSAILAQLLFLLGGNQITLS
ncbi:ArgE Acetylornithine deacetylase/Succinyl-diaminopimelate desuccinylase and related deacylases [Microbacteriaceae bacterium]